MDHSKPKHYFTVDVEDWFQTEAAQKTYPPFTWYKQEPRIEKNVGKILEVLDKYQAKATFFTLGWINDRFPRMIKKIHSAGHEVASHGHDHMLVYGKTPDEFREDILHAKKSLEDTTGEKVIGYRAPMFSIRKQTAWALDILKEEGFLYDSSIYPTSVRPDRPPYDLRQEAYQHPNGLWEFPLPVFKLGKMQIPFAGGSYLRLLPASFTIHLLKRTPESIVYIHPWEIDPQPSPHLTLVSSLRQNIGLKGNLKKVETLLQTFDFDCLKNRLEKGGRKY